MSIEQTILIKSLVRPFYKQNAGLFTFLLFIMVAAVGRANGVGLLEYHLSLIQAIMTSFPFLLFTLCAWFLYGIKCIQFTLEMLGKKDYVFLSLLSLKKPAWVYRKLLLVQIMLLLPVLLYAFIATWIGLHHHWWPNSIIVLVFFLMLTFSSPLWYQFVLNHPDKRRSLVFWKFLPNPKFSFYWFFLIRYICNSRKVLCIVIKIFSCLFLFGLIYNQSGEHSALQMAVLFYSFPLLGHGALIYAIRDMEEDRLTFYRSLPVFMVQRFLQYSLLYFLLFIPELLIIKWLSPVYISHANAILFIFFGYSVILFLNSLLFIRIFRKIDYLKIVTGLFLAIFIAVLTNMLFVFAAGLFVLSVYIFFRCYYRFEKS